MLKFLARNYISVSSLYNDPSNLSDHYAVSVIFRINHDSPPKSIRFRDFSEANAELFALNMENKFISFSPLHSNPNEYADYLVNFLKKIMNKYFPIRHKTITQRPLHSP